MSTDPPAAERLTARQKLLGAGFILLTVLLCAIPIAVLSNDGLYRAIDTEDRGVELLRIPTEKPTTDAPGKSGYSIRAVKTGMFGSGETCVAITTWRNAAAGGTRGPKYKTWQADRETLSCEWPRLDGGRGWMAERIAFPVPADGAQHLFYAVVPDRAVRARITWLDGTSQEVKTRTVKGRDGRFVVLWKPGFGVLPGRSGTPRPEHARIALYDSRGEALDVY